MKDNLINNLILNTDSYKLGHFLQYPDGTKKVFSYIESRGCDFTDHIMMMGIQYFLKKYMSKPITHHDITVAKEFANKHGTAFNEKGWRYIVDIHNGILPLKIRSVKEGTVIPVKNVMLTVENTDPECYWLTSYIETCLLRSIWYPSTVATNSMLCKQIIKKYMDMTSDYEKEELDFKLHDFGARGVSSFESSMVGGMAHLIPFKGTDTIAGIICAMDTYGSDVCGFSINASEHASITSWGRKFEKEAYQNMIRQFAHDGSVFAVVSDSYDIYNATKNIWGKGLLKYVDEKKSTVVIRPDSGNPLTVPVKIINLLMDEVGYTLNSKGYKVLPDYVRVIQGDGINRESLEIILQNLEKEKISATNIAFGMGGGLLQQLDRDTFKFAMKCSAIQKFGIWHDVYKDPIDDKGKKSKKGRITLIKNIENDSYHTIHINDSIKYNEESALFTVYFNGVIENEFSTLEEVRTRCNNHLN